MALDAGPQVWGFDDQRWTLVGVAWLIRRLFHIGYSRVGVSKLLHRLGWSVQVPCRRAVERDEDAIAGWKQLTWPVIKGPRRTWVRGSASRTRRAKV
ncbi:winged helix-turn-helix domain-containing protein [Phytomonospora sp. NPDC050363]|uniref:helix-turn-helix domain-containing protein n=1 Tax=Phytomonospora sp. NPDC050363 TaxID=3155642 RepID=UPI00340D5DD5